MTAGADLRLLRAAVFTAVCVLLSAAGHATAAGAPLPLWALGAGCALVFAAAAPLAGRERSLPGIAALLTAGQAALHVLFATAHRPPPAPAGTDTGSLRALARRLLCNDDAAALSASEARRVVDAAGLPTGPAVTAAGQTAARTGHHAAAGETAAVPGSGSTADAVRTALETALAQLSLPMLLGHLLAAAAVGWLLHRGESALWRLVRASATVSRAAEELLAVRALRAAVRLLRALRHGLTADGAPLTAVCPPDPAGAGPLPAEPLVGGGNRRGPPPASAHLRLEAHPAAPPHGRATPPRLYALAA